LLTLRKYFQTLWRVQPHFAKGFEDGLSFFNRPRNAGLKGIALTPEEVERFLSNAKQLNHSAETGMTLLGLVSSTDFLPTRIPR
jgi:hypothetical protein